MSIDIPDIASDAAAIEREAAARGQTVETFASPDSKTDFLCRLEARWAAADVPLVLTYVPDKLMVSEPAFARFAAGFDPPAGPLEVRAAAALRTLNDDLVPRWIQLRAGAGAHRVLIEDRQPKWQNDALLRRVEPF